MLKTHGQRLRSFMQVKRGQQLSWPIEGIRRLRRSSAAAKTSAFRYVRHHGIVSRVLRGSKVEMLHYSGPNKHDAHVRLDIIDISDKMRSKVVNCHKYPFVKTFKADDVINRGLRMLNSRGLYGRSYNVISCNCEHFATFFKCGASFSMQSKSFHVPE